MILSKIVGKSFNISTKWPSLSMTSVSNLSLYFSRTSLYPSVLTLTEPGIWVGYVCQSNEYNGTFDVAEFSIKNPKLLESRFCCNVDNSLVDG